MGEVSAYERLQIESVLAGRAADVQSGVGLVLIPDLVTFRLVHDIAVLPAMAKNSLNVLGPEKVFDSDSVLSEVRKWVMSAEVIVADVTALNPHVMYVLGLAHGLGRCPIMLSLGAIDLPFNLRALRCLSYSDSKQGLIDLREELGRAIRVFLMSSRA